MTVTVSPHIHFHTLLRIHLSEGEGGVFIGSQPSKQVTNQREESPVGQAIKRIYCCSCASDQRAVLLWLVIHV